MNGPLQIPNTTSSVEGRRKAAEANRWAQSDRDVDEADPDQDPDRDMALGHVRATAVRLRRRLTEAETDGSVRTDHRRNESECRGPQKETRDTKRNLQAIKIPERKRKRKSRDLQAAVAAAVVEGVATMKTAEAMRICRSTTFSTTTLILKAWRKQNRSTPRLSVCTLSSQLPSLPFATNYQLTVSAK